MPVRFESLECFLNPAEIRCPPLRQVINGVRSSDDVGVETVAVFGCKIGFEIGGQHVLKCQHNGSWNGTEPECNGKTKIVGNVSVIFGFP